MKPFKHRIYLSSPTMHGDELKFMTEAYDSNWMSTVGENIDEIEKNICALTGCKHSVALSSGTSALHLAVKLAGIKPGDPVLCSDLTFAATVNPVVYEGGMPVFIDSEYETWNVDPVALEKAFQKYPSAKIVIAVDLYGTPAKMDEISEICQRYGATLIEDAAESLGAQYKNANCGTFGLLNIISFNGNKIITGSSGGMLLSDDSDIVNHARKLSTQSRDSAPWYQHSEIGYNYRMSNVIAGVVRGQLNYLHEHIEKKRAIYMRYKNAFSDLPISMNPYDSETMEPNFWLSCMLIDSSAMCPQQRSNNLANYIKVKGKTCPTEILDRLNEFNAEGRPIWKPMHLQPAFSKNDFVFSSRSAVDEDIFERGLCLPSDIKMTHEQQDQIIAIVRSCFE